MNVNINKFEKTAGKVVRIYTCAIIISTIMVIAFFSSVMTAIYFESHNIQSIWPHIVTLVSGFGMLIIHPISEVTALSFIKKWISD